MKPTIIVTSSAVLPKKAYLSEYKCNECSSRFVTLNSIKPFCFHCGSEDVSLDHEIEDDGYELEDENCYALKCPSCNSFNILDKSNLNQLSGFTCVVCGEELDYSTDEVPLVSYYNQDPSFVRLDDTILAFAGKVCVGRLDKENSLHPELFNKDSFLTALTLSANKDFLKTLQEFNFDLVTVPLHVTHETPIDTSFFKQELEHCLSIAAAGLNKGFFKDKIHHLKSYLYEELSSLGIKGAERIIDKAFELASDQYNQTLIEIAFDLMEKPLDIRNSLAEAISQVNYIPVQSNTENHETRLETPLKPVLFTEKVQRGRLFQI